jgi:pimeloyl-ACP methyl ester carboxylesterase
MTPIMAISLLYYLLAGSPEIVSAQKDSDLCALASHVIRQTAAGHRIEAVLYLPLSSDAVPYPVLVLSHGFLRDYGRHVENPVAFACQGIATFTPNLVPVDAWAADRAQQVADVVDHVHWLRRRALDPEDPLFGTLDPSRFALGGHSAGGAVSVEAAEVLQREGTRISALVLWDAVPDDATLKSAEKIQPLPVLSLRSRPGPCNAYGSTQDLEKSFPFPIQSIFLPSATHCDPESPTDVVCRLFCGGSSESARADYREITGSFLQETLKKPATEKTNVRE